MHTYLHSIACSKELNVLGLPLRKPCIVVRDSTAVPERESNKTTQKHECGTSIVAAQIIAKANTQYNS